MRPSHLLPPAVVVAAACAVAGPLRRPARIGQLVYAATLAVAGVRSDNSLVPVVLVVMHFAHGIGQLRGWLRYGPPVASVASLAGVRASRAEEPVYAPSLQS
jgi:hypothetical protein